MQSIFKEFYSNVHEKTQNFNAKDQFSSAKNSAKSSLGAMSQKLEERRQKLKEMKNEKMGDGFDAKKEEFKATGAVDPEMEQITESETETEYETEEEEEKVTFRQRLAVKAAKYGEKYPNAYKRTSSALSTFKDVWAETFPNEKNKVINKFD